jgi:hypothetical protein
MAPPLKKGFRFSVNLLTMPYLKKMMNFAPASLKSQETNFIDNHLKVRISVNII